MIKGALLDAQHLTQRHKTWWWGVSTIETIITVERNISMAGGSRRRRKRRLLSCNPKGSNK